MRGCSPGREEGRKGPYMKKTPADHAGGIMAEGSSVRRENRKRTEKTKFFGKFFVLDNYVIFLEKWKAAGGKWIRKWISNRGRKPVKAVGIRLRYLPVTMRN